MGLLATLAGLGCEGVGNGGYGEPLIFPDKALLGSTVGMAIDSNYIPVLSAGYYDLSLDNVTIELSGPVPTTVVTPIAVFDAGPASAVWMPIGNDYGVIGEKKGAVVTVVLFNLPTTGLPIADDVLATLLIDGEAVPVGGAGNLYVRNEFDIVGTGGEPIVFAPNSDPTFLEPRPSLRFMAEPDDAGLTGFDPSWPLVVAIEFQLDYDSALVDNPELDRGGEADEGIAILGPAVDQPGGRRRVSVMVIEPQGMRVGDLILRPFLDVFFDKSPSVAFGVADFEILGLRVYDVDGNLLTPVIPPNGNSDSFFNTLTRRDRPES